MGNMRHHAVSLLLLFLCLESTLAQTAVAPALGATRSQLDLQMQAWESFVHVKANEELNALEDEAAHLKDALASAKDRVSMQVQSFSQNALGMQQKISDWGSQHVTMFSQCFAVCMPNCRQFCIICVVLWVANFVLCLHESQRGALSEGERAGIKAQITERFGALAQNGTSLGRMTELVQHIPLMNMLHKNFEDRPDWALWILNSISQNSVGAAILQRLSGHRFDPRDTTQGLQRLQSKIETVCM